MINWLKKHWSQIILVLIILFILIRSNLLGRSSVASLPSGSYGGVADYSINSLSSPPISEALLSKSYRQVAPSDSTDRLVIQDTSLSLQVKDVNQVITDIESATKSLGGFLVNYRLSKPETATSGSIVVRLPEDKRSEALVAFKKMAVKTVSESVLGTDVTDQYVDLQAQLLVLTTTKQKFESILNQATAIADLLNVQRELINLQSQIDSVKGQQKYYEQSAKLSKITIYLSTDELSLPYAPTNEWRPAVIFKQAVRSMLSSLRGLGGLTIWLIAYLPIIIPASIIYWLIRRRKQH